MEILFWSKFDISHFDVTLIIRSMLSISNQLFTPSQQFIYASLVTGSEDSEKKADFIVLIE